MKNKKQELELIGLKVQDLRNIELVNVDFRGKRFIEITGNNGAAKTTIIDSIFLTIIGPKYLRRGFQAWRLVNKDADRALMKVMIGNSERTIEIKRSITKKDDGAGNMSSGGALSITDTDGEKLSQEFLDNLISEFTVDPVSFSRQPPADQINIIKKLGGIDTSKIDSARDTAYQERTIVGRRLKDLAPLVKIEPAKIEPIDQGALAAEYQEATRKNEAIREAKRAAEEFDRETAAIKNQIAKHIEEIKSLNDLVNKLQEDVGEREFEAGKRKDPGTEADLEYLTRAMETAAETNKKAAKRQEYERALKEYQKAQEEYDKYDTVVKKYPEEKTKLIKGSKLPFDNIDFDDEAGLLIDGIPFDQKSDAEKIRISTRIGMAMAPDFKIICIKDGSLLDDNSFAVIKELAEKYDYQVLVERVGEKEGSNQIVMRAGKVISEFAKKPTPEQAAKKMENTL